MSPHPALAQALATQRCAELHDFARPQSSRRPQGRRPRPVQAARRGAGWLLVDMGLRLALPGGTLERPITRAHR